MQPGNLPRTVLAEARYLTAQGKHDEALEKYLWFHEHSLEYNKALAGVRLSFALAEWVELGEKHPPARRALLSIRDKAAEAIERGEGSFSLFHDVAAINRLLRDEADTVRLFKSIHHRHPELAQRCYHVAEPVLVDRGEYAICISYVPDPEQRLEAIRQSHELTLEIAEENFALRSPEARLKEYAEMKFVEETRRLIAILEGVGRILDADRVREFVRDQGRK